MRKGFRRPLNAEDMLPLPERLGPAVVYRDFAQRWAQEQARLGALAGRRREPSILRVLWQMLGWELGIAVALQTLAIVAKFSCVLLVRRLTGIIIANDEERRTEGLIVGIALAVCNALDGLLASHATWRLQLSLYATMGCFAQAVFEKAFVLHPGVQGKFRRGDLVNLALSECSRIVEMSSILMVGVSAPIMLIFAMIFLGVLLGPLVLASFVTILMAILAIRRVAKVQGTSFRAKATWQGRRLSVLNEMLQSVRFTKFYTLEEHYEQQVMAFRGPEVSALRWMKLSLASAWPLAQTVPVTTAAVVLSLCIAVNGGLPSAPDTMAVLAVARFMYFPFAFFGSLLGGWNMLRSVSGRVANLLLQPEVQLLSYPPVDQANADMPAVAIRNRSFRWGLEADQQVPTLKDLEIQVARGELWAVVGALGSGKSSLLAATTGAISPCGESPGVLAAGPSRVLVAQEPMVVNDTLRENVIFGAKEPRDEAMEERYNDALEAAALLPDLDILPAGDQTEIGEKGLTLSGGQKARVALARAVFASKPGGLVLLDDPLAAVDAHVGTHLFEECIVGALKGTTRLLVTNQLQFLDHPAVDRILVMEEGCIKEQGRFADLAADEGSKFSKMLATLGSRRAQQEEGANRPTEGGAARADGARTSITLRTSVMNDLAKDTSGFMKAETKAVGAVSLKALWFYIQALGGLHVFVFICCCSWLFNLSEVGPDLFLAMWQDDVLGQSQEWYLTLWIFIGVGGCCLNLGSRFVWVVAAIRAARSIHRRMLRRVLHCTTSFFDRTPSGRIMSRCGEDMMLVDWTTPLMVEVFCIASWQTVDQIWLVCFVRNLVAPFIVVFALIFLLIREVHRRTNRETMRWNLVTKGPMYHIFEETLSGVNTIQAFSRQDFFRERFEAAVTKNLAWLMTKDASNLWMELRLLFLAALVVATLALQMVYLPGSVSSSIASVAVIYALQLGFNLKTVVYFMVQVEGTFASVERLKDFIDTAEQEPDRRRPEDAVLEQQQWPGGGAALVFEDVCMRYLSHMPLALDHLSASFTAREKVGIVGRTGSGKSSIMGAIFRLFPLEGGRILLGGVDVATCGLGLLRQKITIVPQDPILFSGELRKNLDPLGARTDEQVWNALERCYLAELVRAAPGQLSTTVAEGGRNFSVGERQVLCLARALLRASPVLCLDEATANVDPSNDQRIQHVLTVEVKDCMVLTIAHRLHTVLRSDRIMVLDKGRLAQLDSPKVLLETPGIFRDLARQAGIEKLPDAEATLEPLKATAAPEKQLFSL